MTTAMLMAWLSAAPITEWSLPWRGPVITHDLVQRIDDPANGIVCYVAREAKDTGIAISCVKVRQP